MTRPQSLGVPTPEQSGLGALAKTVGDPIKNVYSTYLSPSRPGLPADAGFLRKYGPLAGTALGTALLLDEEEKPEDIYDEKPKRSTRTTDRFGN